MIGAHIAHDCVLGDNVILTNQATLGGHTEIGEYAILGGLVGVQQHSRIGAHCFIGGMSGISRDVIPFRDGDRPLRAPRRPQRRRPQAARATTRTRCTRCTRPIACSSRSKGRASSGLPPWPSNTAACRRSACSSILSAPPATGRWRCRAIRPQARTTTTTARMTEARRPGRCGHRRAAGDPRGRRCGALRSRRRRHPPRAAACSCWRWKANTIGGSMLSRSSW